MLHNPGLCAFVATVALGVVPATAQFGCERKLLPNVAMQQGGFGYVLALDGDTAAVGPDLHGNRGVVEVFVSRGTLWSGQATVTANDGAALDGFGAALALDGDTLVVGASSAVIDGVATGAAYVFVRQGTTWSQQQKLVASDRMLSDSFGYSVAIDGDTVVAGAAFGGGFGHPGAAYVFTRSGTTWTEQSKLTASDGQSVPELFGNAVDVEGDTIAVGAVFDDIFRGAVYVFARSGTTWNETAKLVASDATVSEAFGVDLDLSGDTLLVGDPQQGIFAVGAAYVFVRNGSGWTEQAKLVSSDGLTYVRFGQRVALRGDTAVVAARDADQMGAVYVYERRGAIWTQSQKLGASDAARDDDFGRSVELDGDHLAVGAPLDEGAVLNSGSVYVYQRSVTGVFAPFGSGCLGGGGVAPDHFSTDTPQIGTTVTLQVRHLQPNTLALLWLGFSDTSWNGIGLPLGLDIIGADASCRLLVEPFVSLWLPVDAAGAASKSLFLPPLLPIGADVFTQVVAADPLVTSALQVVVSNGLHAVIGCQ